MSVLQQQSTLDGMDIRFVSDLGVNVHAQMYAWPVLQVGKTSGGKLVPIAVDADGNLTATIATGDIEIGAVELKDAGTDTRANILAANTARTTSTVVLATQNIDELGKVLSNNTTTQVSAFKTAGQSVTIPIGAKEWTVSVITGTATVNGAAGCPAGFSDGSTKANAAAITIAFDTPGTGYVRYAT